MDDCGTGRCHRTEGVRAVAELSESFQPTTTISYELSANSYVSLKVYDVLEREIQTLAKGRQNAGDHSVRFDASNLPSGVYFYRIDAVGNDGQKFVSTKKLVLMK